MRMPIIMTRPLVTFRRTRPRGAGAARQSRGQPLPLLRCRPAGCPRRASAPAARREGRPRGVIDRGHDGARKSEAKEGSGVPGAPDGLAVPKSAPTEGADGDVGGAVAELQEISHRLAALDEGVF